MVIMLRASTTCNDSNLDAHRNQDVYCANKSSADRLLRPAGAGPMPPPDWDREQRFPIPMAPVVRRWQEARVIVHGRFSGTGRLRNWNRCRPHGRRRARRTLRRPLCDSAYPPHHVRQPTPDRVEVQSLPRPLAGSRRRYGSNEACRIFRASGTRLISV